MIEKLLSLRCAVEDALVSLERVGVAVADLPPLTAFEPAQRRQVAPPGADEPAPAHSANAAAPAGGEPPPPPGRPSRARASTAERRAAAAAQQRARRARARASAEPAPTIEPPASEVECAYCGQTFPKVRGRKFCSPECRAVSYRARVRAPLVGASWSAEITAMNGALSELERLGNTEANPDRRAEIVAQRRLLVGQLEKAKSALLQSEALQ